jgi:hypothetical protein
VPVAFVLTLAMPTALYAQDPVKVDPAGAEAK